MKNKYIKQIENTGNNIEKSMFVSIYVGICPYGLLNNIKVGI